MTSYTSIILLTLFGFLALAAILLVPVYRFLRREEQVARKWTNEEIARRAAGSTTNGKHARRNGAEGARPPSGGRQAPGAPSPPAQGEDLG